MVLSENIAVSFDSSSVPQGLDDPGPGANMSGTISAWAVGMPRASAAMAEFGVAQREASLRHCGGCGTRGRHRVILKTREESGYCA
jgi:hypothetical protein